MADRKDPLPVFCFLVKLDGLPGEMFFKSVSGIKYELETIPVREGGQNETVFNMIGGSKWSNLILKQGFTKDSAILKWRDDWVGKPGGRKDVQVTILDTALTKQKTWTAKRGIPVKWEISEFDASKSELAIETLEIAHEGLTIS